MTLVYPCYQKTNRSALTKTFLVIPTYRFILLCHKMFLLWKNCSLYWLAKTGRADLNLVLFDAAVRPIPGIAYHLRTCGCKWSKPSSVPSLVSVEVEGTWWVRGSGEGGGERERQRETERDRDASRMSVPVSVAHGGGGGRFGDAVVRYADAALTRMSRRLLVDIHRYQIQNVNSPQPEYIKTPLGLFISGVKWECFLAFSSILTLFFVLLPPAHSGEDHRLPLC